MAWRLGAGTLAVLHCALTLAAARHAGDHSGNGLAWLPAAFHQHSYQLVADPAGTPAPVADPCLACAIGRTPLGLAATRFDLPTLPILALARNGSPASGAPLGSYALHAPRGPPLG